MHVLSEELAPQGYAEGTVTVTHWLGTDGPYSIRFWTSFHTAATAFRASSSSRPSGLFPLRSELPRRRGYARRAVVSYETVRRWALKFGGIIARQLR